MKTYTITLVENEEGLWLAQKTGFCKDCMHWSPKNRDGICHHPQLIHSRFRKVEWNETGIEWDYSEDWPEGFDGPITGRFFRCIHWETNASGKIDDMESTPTAALASLVEKLGLAGSGVVILSEEDVDQILEAGRRQEARARFLGL